MAEAVRWRLPSLDSRADENPVAQDGVVAAQPVAESVLDADAADAKDSISEDPLNPESEPLDSEGADGASDSETVSPETSERESPATENAEIDAIREAARAEGLEAGRVAGHAEGLEAGRAAGRAELDVELERAQQLIAYLQKPLDETDDRLEEELVALSVAVARQLVRRELQTAPGEIIPVVREALAVLPSAQRNVTVLLHPEDASLVRQALTESAESAAWHIAEDPLLSRGGCRVDAGFSHVDATLETRLHHIAVALATRSRDDD